MGYFPGNHRSDFRLVFKKHSDANQGKHGIILKTFYTMFTRKKFGDRNEEDRFQAMASSTSLYNVRLRKSFRAERKL
jgi:hypothetical protein